MATETEINWAYANNVEDPIPAVSSQPAPAGNDGEHYQCPRSHIQMDSQGYVMCAHTGACLGRLVTHPDTVDGK